MSKKYDTFAAYLEDVYYNQIFSKIKSYLFNNKGRLDLSTSVVPDPSYVELSDFKIIGENCFGQKMRALNTWSRTSTQKISISLRRDFSKNTVPVR